VRPPESAVAWTGNVLNRIGVGMVISVIRDPRAWRTRSIEDSTKNEQLFENRIQLNRTMRQGAMESDVVPNPPTPATINAVRNTFHPGVGNNTIPTQANTCMAIM